MEFAWVPYIVSGAEKYHAGLRLPEPLRSTVEIVERTGPQAERMFQPHHFDMTETDPPADNSHAQMLPFYSARTLGELHTLVTNLDRGLAVYVRQNHAFATIGTRGIRPFDGSPGLIIHLSVHLDDDQAAASAPTFIPHRLVHNTEHTPATEAEIKTGLVAALETAGLIPAGSRWDDPRWRFF